jgi:hypothetical protein
MTKISFLDKVKSSSSSTLYLITGIDNSIECWYYLDVNPLKLSIFKKDTIEGQQTDLLSFGKILVSGWGDKPPAHIVGRIDQFGAAYNPETDEEWQRILADKSTIYFIQAKDKNNEEFHAYIAVNGSMADKFTDDAIKGDINIYNYGQVVLIDWGSPTEETKKEMSERYGVDHNYIDALLANA